ncbi:vomeronasal type-2 receptor 26-like [Tenrec ecaudatus]|uniref:vomeronasal type-2 receptor 26-like n=1 Tax=Tenrec ecaudatus TaxID=94439 RepID=UPI003F5A5030
MLLSSLWLCHLLALFAITPAGPEAHGSRFERPGDVIIGGLFPLTPIKDSSLANFTFQPVDLGSTEFSTWMYLVVQAFVFAIEEINRNGHILPNVTLGFSIRNTYDVVSRGLLETMDMLSGWESPIPNYSCRDSPPLVAVVGESRSTITMPIARYLGLYKFSQVSYSATIVTLSDKTQFPSFLRTASSDQVYFPCILQILTHFGWVWVGMVSQSDDYGWEGSRLIHTVLPKAGICLEFTVNIPLYESIDAAGSVIRVIKASTAKVILLFLTNRSYCLFLPVLSGYCVVGRLLVNTFSLNKVCGVNFPGIAQFQQESFTAVDHRSVVRGLDAFLGHLHPNRTPEDAFIRRFWGDTFKCEWPTGDHGFLTNDTGIETAPLCTGDEDLKDPSITLLNAKHGGTATLAYLAVYSIAQALQALRKDAQRDQWFETRAQARTRSFYQPWQLLPHLRNVHFTAPNGNEVFFDANGDTPGEFDILHGQDTPEGAFQFMAIGKVSVSTLSKAEGIFNDSAIRWRGGVQQANGSSRVPRSVCSESCPPGFIQVLRPGWPQCCFDCHPCPEEHFTEGKDSVRCRLCPEGEYPNRNKDRCLPKTEVFLSYGEAWGLTMACLSVFFTVLTALVLGVFVKYQDTPIVKANNQMLSYILLVALMLCFLCPLLFIGRPTAATCLLRQTTFLATFTVAVSSVLAKTITVVVAFQATRPVSRIRRWVGPQTAYSVVFFCSLIQVAICGIWLGSSPPFPTKDSLSLPGHLIIQCNEGSVVAFYCALGYLGFLILGTFGVAFLARNLPDTFNEAKFLTFSMLVSCSVWVSFLPSYQSTQGKAMVVVEILTILASGAGLLGCIFAPKCYVILFHPERNTHRSWKKKAVFQ